MAVVVTLGGVAGPIGAPADGAEVLDEPVVAMVVDAIRANYSHIRTAELTVRTTVTDTNSFDTVVEEEGLPGGAVASIQRSPKSVRSMRVWLAGDSLRVDRFEAGAPDQLAESLVRHKGIWTQHVGPLGAAWIRRPQEMPSQFPVDPRDYGSQEASRSMIQVLTEDKIVAARIAPTEEGKPVARVVTLGRRGNKTDYEFAASNAYLPTRLLTRWPDGSLLQLVEIDYQKVLGDRACFPTRMVRSFYPRGATSKPSEHGWRQQVVQQVTGDIAFNRGIEESVFETALPEGTRVSDNVRLAVYNTVAQASEEDAWGLRYVTAVVVASLLVAVVVKHSRPTY